MSNDDSGQEGPNNHPVGYGKPPRQTQFQKGRSGNPAGRPKGSRSLNTCLMTELKQIVPIKQNGRSRLVSKREAAAIQMVNKAVMGDLRAFKAVADLTDQLERREEEQISARAGQTSRERIERKLEEMAARMRLQQGLPPESE